MNAAPEATKTAPAGRQDRPPISRRALTVGGAVGVSVLVAALTAGILPRVARQHRLTAAVAVVSSGVPSVSVATVGPAPTSSPGLLPRALPALRTAPIYARTPRHLRRRLVDIGSHVRAGQLLAEIHAPDVDQQVAQA